MKKRNHQIKDDVKLRLKRIRESLTGVPLDDEEMSIELKKVKLKQEIN